MPFSTRRSSTRGTPRGLLGRSGAITRHSKSVRSYRLMHMLNQISHATPIPFMGLRPSSQSWGKRQDRWLLLNPKNANVELETNDSQTAARAWAGADFASSCRLAGNSNSLLAWPKRLRAVHKRPFHSLDRLLDRNRLYCEVSNKWSIVCEQDEEC